MPRKKGKKIPPSNDFESGLNVDNGNINANDDSIINSNIGEVVSQQENIPINGDKVRTRTYAFLLYPDSAVPDWRDKLNDLHVEALVSPLHDKDINPDGTLKKPHWHVLIMYSSVKTLTQAKQLRDILGGVGWENVASTRGYARYLCHLDNPEKAQYSQDDVIEFGGADYAEIIRRSSDNVKTLAEMMQFIDENNINFYYDFVKYCKSERLDWFEVLVTRSTYTIYTYIKARAYKLVAMENAVDEETGELKGVLFNGC